MTHSVELATSPTPACQSIGIPLNIIAICILQLTLIEWNFSMKWCNFLVLINFFRIYFSFLRIPWKNLINQCNERGQPINIISFNSCYVRWGINLKHFFSEQRVHPVCGPLPADDAPHQRVPLGVRPLGRNRGHRQRSVRTNQLPDPIPGTYQVFITFLVWSCLRKQDPADCQCTTQ